MSKLRVGTAVPAGGGRPPGRPLHAAPARRPPGRPCRPTFSIL